MESSTGSQASRRQGTESALFHEQVLLGWAIKLDGKEVRVISSDHHDGPTISIAWGAAETLDKATHLPGELLQEQA